MLRKIVFLVVFVNVVFVIVVVIMITIIYLSLEKVYMTFKFPKGICQARGASQTKPILQQGNICCYEVFAAVNLNGRF